MGNLARGHVRLRIHGAHGGAVSAAVFARKLGTLVKALKAADTVANGRVLHDYEIADLKPTSALVDLKEIPIPQFEKLASSTSAVPVLAECITAIQTGDVEATTTFGRCTDLIAALAVGAEKSFGYGELWVKPEDPVRVDTLLDDLAKTVIKAGRAKPEAAATWFKGFAYGAFDGQVKEVDLRGAMPQVKLILSAGGKEIDCIFREFDIQQIKNVLDQRVRVEGKAIYDGKSGLPRRVEINAISAISSDVDFSKWRGSFEPFTPQDWDSDNDA